MASILVRWAGSALTLALVSEFNNVTTYRYRTDTEIITLVIKNVPLSRKGVRGAAVERCEMNLRRQIFPTATTLGEDFSAKLSFDAELSSSNPVIAHALEALGGMVSSEAKVDLLRNGTIPDGGDFSA